MAMRGFALISPKIPANACGVATPHTQLYNAMSIIIVQDGNAYFIRNNRSIHRWQPTNAARFGSGIEGVR